VSIHKWPFLPCSAFSAGFRLRRTGVRLTENPCLSRHSPFSGDGGCGLDQDKNCSFLNWTPIVFILY
jgi:hypothetical protein